jgi:hypothetical protein
MSFDEISPMREALSALPLGYVNTSESSLLWVIVSYPNGCFEGIEKLAQMARQTERTTFANLRNLSDKNLILKEQKFARKGLRQCYRLNMAEIERINQSSDIERVRLITPNKRVQLESDMGAINKPKGAIKSSKGSDTQHPYKEYKNNKYDKELFDEFTSGLKDQSLIPYIQAGSNLDDLLKRVIQQDTSFKALHDYLGQQNFATSEKVGGLLIYFINKYLDALKAKSEAITRPVFVTNWCGRCNEVTRRSYEVFIGADDFSVHECPVCHPEGIKQFQHIAKTLDPENKKAYIELVKSLGGADFL